MQSPRGFAPGKKMGRRALEQLLFRNNLNSPWEQHSFSCLKITPIFLHCFSKKLLSESAAHSPWLLPLTLPNQARRREFSLCPSRIQVQNPEGSKSDRTRTSKCISYWGWAAQAPRSAKRESMIQRICAAIPGWEVKLQKAWECYIS